MDSNHGEPSSKRPRTEHLRHIKLDMTKYDISVQKLSDEELVKIFELGLKVRESAILTVDNQKMVEDVLASKSTGDPHKRLVCLFVCSKYKEM